jgi:SAM-dependent methyltransferase
MKSTPVADGYNHTLFALMPGGLRRVVEVGCSIGQLAAEYRKHHPQCDYIGIEIDPDYAEMARPSCSRVICGDVETLPDDAFAALFPSNCWVFGDSLEHLRDPWALLRRIRARLPAEGHIVACLPNMQHWSVQWRLTTGNLRYEDAGLLDRTHLRWFTRTTMAELFAQTGYKVVRWAPRVFDHPKSKPILNAIAAMATVLGHDPQRAVDDATPLQWVIHAQAA